MTLFSYFYHYWFYFFKTWIEGVAFETGGALNGPKAMREWENYSWCGRT